MDRDAKTLKLVLFGLILILGISVLDFNVELDLMSADSHRICYRDFYWKRNTREIIFAQCAN
jgi:hypothetical protein